MGQYHTIINITKKEYFSIGMAKLLEKSYDPACSTALMVLLCNSNGRGGGDLCIRRDYYKNGKPKPLKGKLAMIQDALDQVQGRWAGDQIVIQGDYAEPGDPAYLTKYQTDELKDITKLVELALEAEPSLKEEKTTMRPDMVLYAKK